MKQVAKRALVFCAKLAVGGACLYWAYRSISPETWRAAAANTRWVWLMALGWVLNQIFCALRLQVLLNVFGFRLRGLDAMKLAFATFLVSSIFPGVVVGDAAKIGLLRLSHREGGLAELTLVTLLDRLFGVLSLWFASFILSFVAPLPPGLPMEGLVWLVRLGLLAPLAMVAGLAFLAHPRSAWIVRPLRGRPAVLAERARGLAQTMGHRRSVALLLGQAVPLSMLAVAVLIAAQAVTGAFVLTSLGHEPRALLQAFLAPTSLVVSTLPLAPSGLGIGQLTLGAIYSLAKLDPAGAVLLTTLVQASQLAVACTVGVVAFLTLRGQTRAASGETTP